MFGGSVFGQDQFGQGPSSPAPAVSLAITSSIEVSADAVLGSSASGPSQGRGGFYDAFQSYPQKLTVRARSAVEVGSAAVMGVRVPVPKIPGVSIAVKSGLSAPSSQARMQERMGMRAASNIEVGSDSTFAATISALEYDRLVDAWEDESFVMRLAFDLLEV